MRNKNCTRQKQTKQEITQKRENSHEWTETIDIKIQD